MKEAYTWLAGKYQEGDQIYFFGQFPSLLTGAPKGFNDMVRFLSGRISSQGSGLDDIRGNNHAVRIATLL